MARDITTSIDVRPYEIHAEFNLVCRQQRPQRASKFTCNNVDALNNAVSSFERIFVANQRTLFQIFNETEPPDRAEASCPQLDRLIASIEQDLPIFGQKAGGWANNPATPR